MAEALAAAQSEQYDVERFRWYDAGVMQLPVAAANGDAAIVRLHAPRSGVVIAFTVRKWGEPPTIPNPYSLEENAIFLGGWNSGAIPMLDSSLQGRHWEVKGIYWYANVEPVLLNSDLPTGRTSFDPADANDNTISSDYFSDDILGTDESKTEFTYTLPG